MKDLSLEERRDILLDAQVMKGKEVREKWDITNNTLSHIRFFHGKSSAKARGYYHKDLVSGTEHPLKSEIKPLKEQGMTSGEVAKALGIDLEVINRNW